jgi:hypothetical protein
LVCCVTATGDACCPLLVSSDLAARTVFEHQIRDGIDLQIEINPSTYVNAEIFERYVDTVLIPAVEANRQLPGRDNKPAILFCDNYSAHILNSMFEKLARHGILVLTYPPHISHRFQVLDVLLFGLVKRSTKYQIRDDTLPIHVNHILRFFRAYEAAMASTTMRETWRQTGFEYENMNVSQYKRRTGSRVTGLP